MKRKNILLSFMCFVWMSVQGQVVKVNVVDTALQSKTLFVVMAKQMSPQIIRPTFDKNGNYEFLDTCSWAEKKSFLVLDQELKNVYTAPKSVTSIKISADKKGKKVKCQYKGYANDAYILSDSISSAYSFPKYFSLVGDKNETLDNYEQKLAMLDNYHAMLIPMAQNLKEKELAVAFGKSIECEYLRFRLGLMKAYDNAHGVDIVEDKDYQALLDKIDVNDPKFEEYFLITQYLKGKISSKLDDAPVEWGCEFLKQANKYIKDPKIKRDMDLQAIQYVTTYATGDEIDKFWIPFKETADSVVVKAYAAKVESMKNTKVGMMAYDSEFCDQQGNIHKISEFKGKLLYVDFWATWCGPCKAEIPHLAKLVEHYKENDKVQFISVSVDTNKEAWVKMVAKDQPKWPQFIATKEQHEKISKDWGITGIPRFLMINADGTIYSADAIRPSDSKIITLMDKLIK